VEHYYKNDKNKKKNTEKYNWIKQFKFSIVHASADTLERNEGEQKNKTRI
jgi:hypothetical protein